MRKFLKRAVALATSAAIAVSCVPFVFADDADNGLVLTISQPEELLAFARSVNNGENYSGYTVTLDSDIDMSGEEYVSAGNGDNPFKGVFDGADYSVINLEINGGDYTGFIGCNEGTVKDLYVDADVSGNMGVAVIAGVNRGNIENCTSSGFVGASSENSGGITGYMAAGTISDCVNNANVKSNGRYSAGVAGNLAGGSIVLCTNYGDISASGTDAGGIAGYFTSGTISRCVNFAQIASSGTCGGIVGYANGGNVSDCRNAGTVTAPAANSGGIAGGIDKSWISYCYSTGAVASVNAGQYLGGAVGWNRSGTVTNCYCSDKFTSAVGKTESAAVTNNCKMLSAQELALGSSFEGFDFDSVWSMDAAAPLLAVELTDSDRLEKDVEWLSFAVIGGKNSESNNVSGDLYPPLRGRYGSKISWTTSDGSVMLESGVAVSAGDVTLTAHLSSGLLTKSKEFALTVTTDEQAERMHILQIGDSNTQFARITQSMNKILKKEHGNYSDGFITLCKNYVSVENKNTPKNLFISYEGDWKQYDLVDGATSELKQAQDSPFGLYLKNSVKGDKMTVTFTASAVDLYYYSHSGAGSFSVAIDGEEKGEINQASNDNTTKKSEFTGLDYGVHTMVIENTGGVINFFGADYRIDSAGEDRVNISTWGKAGIQAMQYAAVLNETIFDSALKLANPDKVVLLIGTNDNGLSGCSSNRLEGYLNTILQRIKSALPDTEVWLVSTFETNNNKDILHSYWDSAFPNAAKNNSVHYWSMGEWYGDFSSDWMADGWHSNNAGSRKIAEKMYEVITRGEDVVGRNIVSAGEAEKITVKSGTAANELPLPQKVKATLDDLQSSVKYLPVQWDTGTYGESAGEYILTARFADSQEDRIYNPNNIVVSVTVQATDDYTPPENEICEYDFEDSGSKTVTDISGGFNGTLSGRAAFADGYIGGGVSLNGSGTSYVNLSADVFDQADSVSISMWVNLKSVSNWTTLLSVGSGRDNYVVLAAKGTPDNSSCGVTMAIRAKGGSEYRVKAAASKAVPAGKWTHICYTQSYEDACIYLNGELVAQTDSMKASIRDVVNSAASTARVGAANVWGDPSVNGVIDEFKVCRTALTQSEVKGEYDGYTAEHERPENSGTDDIDDNTGNGISKPDSTIGAVTTPENGTASANGKTVLYKSGKLVTGTKIVTVSGKTYFVKNGYVLTGKARTASIGKKTYVVNKKGILQKSAKGNKLVKVGKRSYVVNKKGVVQKGSKNKLVKVGKKKYIVNKKGVVLKNKKSVKAGKKSYKTNKNGVATLKK